MQNYLDALKNIIENGGDRKGRNGWTRSLFAIQLRFKMQEGFPALTTKKLAIRTVIGELLWFIEGSGNDNRLKEIMGKDRTIWTDNAEAPYWKDKAQYSGDLGRIYGVQWRNWRSVRIWTDRSEEMAIERTEIKTTDQLEYVIKTLKTDPHNRRLVVSAWNVGELNQMALPPCHMIFQFFSIDGKISLHMVQRSCDMFLGVPFNIASYAFLLSMVAQVVNMEPYECILTLNDAHIYHEHFEAVKEQLGRKPKKLPRLQINPHIKDIEKFHMTDFDLQNYEPHPAIKARMIV